MPPAASRIVKSRALILVVTAAVLIAASTALLGNQAEAAITTAFSPRFQANVNGSIILRGNANLVCPPSAACTSGQNGVGTGNAVDNNGFVMEAANADGDATTFNDSRATVDIPAGATVLFAGLYWSADPTAGTSGSAAPTSADKNKVLFRTPSAATWQQITAGTLFTDATVAAFQGFADVTSQVAGTGSGVYSVANIQAGTGIDRYAGWALAIAYQKSSEPMHSLRVFDGFGVVNSATPQGQVHIPVSGFQTPQNGTVHAKIGAVVYEGDLGKTGDALQVDGQPLSDGVNPANNVFNSTVSDGGTPVAAARTPGNANLMGVDIDQFTYDHFSNNVQNADLLLTTGGETYYPGVVTFTTDLYAPELVATVGGTDVNGGDLVPGDEIEYRIDVRNDGTDAAKAAVLSDAIPSHTTYVPGSMKIGGSAVSDDPSDGDAGKFAAPTATWGIGTSPNGTAGGQLAYQTTTYVTFRVKVDADAAANSQILNVANTSYQASYNSLSITGVSGSSGMTVLQPKVDLVAGLAVAPAVVQRAAAAVPVSYTATVTNSGHDLEPAAVARLTLPTGVTAGTLPAGCTAAGQVITCATGPLATGSTKTLVVPAGADNTADPAVTATLVVSGTGQDTVPANDSATAVLRVNSAPHAVDDAASTDSATAVSIAVRGNDTDADDAVSSLAVSVVSAPAHGAAVGQANGTVRYTPAAGWVGADTFTYQVDDGNGGTSTATVTVTVTAAPVPVVPNAPPVAADESVHTAGNTAVRLTVLADATDPNPGDTLRVIGTTDGAHGTVTRNADGSITYTPAAGFAGTDTFSYTVGDGHGGSDTAQVTVVVTNGVPTAGPDAVTVPANTTAVIDVLANDDDPNGDPLTVTVDTAPQHGTATPGTDGRITYVPASGYRGTDTFHYTIRDGHGGSAGATVTVGVAESAPYARPDSVLTDTDTSVVIRVLDNDTDPNGDRLGVTATTAAGHGTVTRAADGTLTYAPAAGFFGTDTFTYTVQDPAGLTASAIVTVTVRDAPPIAVADRFIVHPGESTTLALLTNDRDPNTGQALRVATLGPAGKGTATLAADGTVTYRPDAMTSGTDTFDYVLTDDLGLTSTATVTLLINAAPVAVPDSANTRAGTPVDIGVVDDDTDAESEALTVDSVSTPAHGTAVLAGGRIRYTPAAGWTGTDTFTYVVRDTAGNTATGTVTVRVGDAAPTAVPDVAAVVTGRAVTVDILGNDSDPNPGQTLTVSAVGAPAHGTAVVLAGKIRYTPADGFAGTDTFTYTVRDGHGNTATSTVTVTVTNGGPAALPDARTTTYQHSVTVPVLANDLDPGATLGLTELGKPDHGTARISGGNVIFDPPSGFSGVATFTYTATDRSGAKATATVTITVGAAPVVPDKAVRAKPGTAVTIKLPTTDENGEAVTARSIGKPKHGTARLNADGTVTYVAEAGFSGVDSLSYEVVDADGNVAAASITITVTGRNRAPIATGDPVSVPAGGSTVIHPLTNDKDPNGDRLAVVRIGKPRHGTAVLNSDGTVTYAPSRAYTGGTDSFAYTISDGHGGTAQATITVTVVAAAAADGSGGSAGNLAKTGLNVLSIAAAGMLAVVLGGVFYLGGRGGGVRLPALAGVEGSGPGRHRPGRHRG